MLEIIKQSQWFEIVSIILGLYYFYHTRFRGNPAMVSKYVIFVLILDILILPVLIIFCAELVMQFEHNSIVKSIVPNPELARSALLYLAVFWLLARGLDAIVLQKYVLKRTGFSTPLLLRGVCYGIVLFFGLVLFLWRIDYPITGFVVSTGLIAGVVGLAMQPTLSNLFSGIAISLEKPFTVGDWIELQDKTVGQVIEITWRSVWLKTFFNTVLYIPNSELSSQPVTNLNKPDAPYSQWYMMKLSPEIEPSLVKTVLTTAVGQCHHVLPTPAPTVRLNNASESPYVYSVWVHYRNYLAHFRGQEELFTKIHSALTNAGIQVSGPVLETSFAKKRVLNPVNIRVSDILRSQSIFSELDNVEIERVSKASELVTVDAETILVHEKEKTNKIYIVLNGELQSSVTLENGRKIMGENFSVGNSFGWSSIFIEEMSIMTVTAVSDALVLTIGDQCIKTTLSNHPHLIQRFTDLVIQRIQNLDKARMAATRSRLIPRTPAEIKKRIENFIKN